MNPCTADVADDRRVNARRARVAAESRLPRGVQRKIAAVAREAADQIELELRTRLLRAAARRWPLGCKVRTGPIVDLVLEHAVDDVLASEAM